MLFFAGMATTSWLLYEIATGRRQLITYLLEFCAVYGPLGLILLIAIKVDLVALALMPVWVIFMVANGRQRVVSWLIKHFDSGSRAEDSQSPANDQMSEQIADKWMWLQDPAVDDPEYFGNWFDDATKDRGGFYAEHLIIGEDGRIDPIKRADGSTAMLPAFFHQFRRSNDGKIVTRGPTIEEFYQIMSVLQRHLAEFEFIIEEDPQRRWIKYRVRR